MEAQLPRETTAEESIMAFVPLANSIAALCPKHQYLLRFCASTFKFIRTANIIRKRDVTAIIFSG